MTFVRSLIFVCVIFTILEVGKWLYLNEVSLIIPYISLCTGITIAYIFKIIEGL